MGEQGIDQQHQESYQEAQHRQVCGGVAL